MGPIGEQPPPSNGDRPSGNPDQAPSNPDRPSSNPDRPIGGTLQGLCLELCDRLSSLDCGPDSDFGDVETEGCDQECVIPAEVIPCETQFIDFFNCILTLPNLCQLDDAENESSLLACADAAQGFADCAGEIDTDPDPGPGPGGGEGGAPGGGPGPGSGEECTQADGCFGCEDGCSACECTNPGSPVCDQLCADQ